MVSASLPPERFKELEDAITNIVSAQLAARKAEDAGLDVKELEVQLEERRKQLVQIKEVYFPNGAPIIGANS